MTTFDPQDWLTRLRGPASVRAVALEDLRGYLVRGLTKSLSHRYGGGVDPEDIAQLALLKILDALDSYRGEARFTTWAMSIAVRIGISELRKAYYRHVSLDDDGRPGAVRVDVPDADACSADVALARQGLFAQLQELIDVSLSERQRVALRGSLEGLSVEVLADRLGSNRNAIYKLLHDARLKLRTGLEARGVTADDILSLMG